MKNDSLTSKLDPTRAEYEIWLLGQPPLREYLDFAEEVASEVVNAEMNLDPRTLADEWRAANDYYQQLEESEHGIADQNDCRELDRSSAALAEELTSHPLYRSTFNSVPTSLGMVEIGKLVVYQKSVTGNFVDAVAARLGESPDPESIFRLCLPLQPPAPPVEVRRLGSKRYVFRSESTDFRYHDSVVLQSRQIQDYQSFGPIAGVVGIVVGFGSNFFNVIRVGDRYLLHNGYHRACALYSRGITHAPCVIQTVTRGDELDMTAKSVVTDDPDFYFRSARPPLIKDFFDPRILKILPMTKRMRMIEVSFEVRDYLVPA